MTAALENTPGVIPDVSVIIACFNAASTLPIQLEALSCQQDAPPFEVILADNGSSDDLLPLVDSFSDRLDIRYVWAGQMPGAGYARNVGMSIARADKWLFCDADDVVAPDWVARGAETLDCAPAFSGGAVHANDAELEAQLGKLWERFDHEARPIEVAERPAQWPIILGGNFGIRKSEALSVGGFDPSMAFGVEDNDLAIRLEDSGILISKGHTSRIIYRKRDDLSSVLRRSETAGLWHMALVERHGLADRSPELRGARWMADPLRVLGAAMKNARMGRRGNWSAVCARAGLAAGLWRGWLKYHVGGLPASLTGAGLGDREPGLAEGATVLVLAPHLDDALFSCSELIRRTRPEVWTVFAGDPDPAVTTSWDRSCGFPDSHALVTQRRGEDLAAFNGTGAQVRQLDMLDGAYTTPSRRVDDLARLADEVRSWIAAHQDRTSVIVLPACAGVSVSPGVVDRLIAGLGPLRGALRGRRAGEATAEGKVTAVFGIRDPADAGVGEGRNSARPPRLRRTATALKHLKHRLYQRRRARAQSVGLAVNDDHLAVRDTVLDALREAPTEGGQVRVLLAEDLPYLWSQTGDDEVRRLSEQIGARTIALEYHVDRVWKHARIAHYTSQVEVMDPARHRLNSPKTIPPVERCWELVWT